MEYLFKTYFSGILVSIIAGFIVFFVIKQIFDWLPTSADLHEKFRDVTKKTYARDRIASLTPLIFISFFWLFLANMLWVLLEVIVEILRLPDVLQQSGLSGEVPQLIIDMRPGLVIGSYILYIAIGLCIAYFFAKGFRIAKQCWEVYRAVNEDNEEK